MLTPIAPPNHWPTRVTSSTNVTLGAGDAVLLCSNTSDAVVALPAAATVAGNIFAVKKIGSNTATVTLYPNGSETIDGATTYVLYVVGDYVVIQSDGSNWHVVGGYLTPHYCWLYTATSQPVSSATETACAFDGVREDIGGLHDTTSKLANIRRPGLYQIKGWWSVENVANASNVQCRVRVNGVDITPSTSYLSITSQWSRSFTAADLVLAAGDEVTLTLIYSAASTPYNTPTTFPATPQLFLTEVR